VLLIYALCVMTTKI